VGGVLEGKARLLVADRLEAHVDPADVAPVLPRGRQVTRRLAGRDGAAGVALELVTTDESRHIDKLHVSRIRLVSRGAL
jgi:hypothetical protein